MTSVPPLASTQPTASNVPTAPFALFLSICLQIWRETPAVRRRRTSPELEDERENHNHTHTIDAKLFGYLFPFFVKCWWQFYFCLRNKDNKTLYLTETFMKWTQSQTYCRDSHTDHTAGRHQWDEDLDDLHSWWSQHTKMTQKEADSKQRLGVTWTLFTKTWFKRERQILINMGRGLYTWLIQEYEHKNYEHEWGAIYKCVT